MKMLDDHLLELDTPNVSTLTTKVASFSPFRGGDYLSSVRAKLRQSVKRLY